MPTRSAEITGRLIELMDPAGGVEGFELDLLPYLPGENRKFITEDSIIILDEQSVMSSAVSGEEGNFRLSSIVSGDVEPTLEYILRLTVPETHFYAGEYDFGPFDLIVGGGNLSDLLGFANMTPNTPVTPVVPVVPVVPFKRGWVTWSLDPRFAEVEFLAGAREVVGGKQFTVPDRPSGDTFSFFGFWLPGNRMDNVTEVEFETDGDTLSTFEASEDLIISGEAGKFRRTSSRLTRANIGRSFNLEVSPRPKVPTFVVPTINPALKGLGVWSNNLDGTGLISASQFLAGAQEETVGYQIIMPRAGTPMLWGFWLPGNRMDNVTEVYFEGNSQNFLSSGFNSPVRSLTINNIAGKWIVTDTQLYTTFSGTTFRWVES